MLPTLLGVLVIAFVFVRLMPGDPATLKLGDGGSVEAIKELRTQMGLDQPIIIQFGHYLVDVAHGDLGT